MTSFTEHIMCSCYSIDYYRRVLHSIPLRQSCMVALYIIALISSINSLAVISTVNNLNISDSIAQLAHSESLFQIFPSELEITLTSDGELKINQELPYGIEIPTLWRNSIVSTSSSSSSTSASNVDDTTISTPQSHRNGDDLDLLRDIQTHRESLTSELFDGWADDELIEDDISTIDLITRIVQSFDYLIVFDHISAPVDSIERYNSLILCTENRCDLSPLLTGDDEPMSISIPSIWFSTLRITRQTITNVLMGISNIWILRNIWFLSIILGALTFMVLAIVLLSSFVFLSVVWGVVCFALLKCFVRSSNHYSFLKVMQVNMHAQLPFLLLDMLIPLDLISSSALYLLVMLQLLYAIKDPPQDDHQQQQHQQQQQPPILPQGEQIPVEQLQHQQHVDELPPMNENTMSPQTDPVHMSPVMPMSPAYASQYPAYSSHFGRHLYQEMRNRTRGSHSTPSINLQPSESSSASSSSASSLNANYCGASPSDDENVVASGSPVSSPIYPFVASPVYSPYQYAYQPMYYGSPTVPRHMLQRRGSAFELPPSNYHSPRNERRASISSTTVSSNNNNSNSNLDE